MRQLRSRRGIAGSIYFVFFFPPLDRNVGAEPKGDCTGHKSQRAGRALIINTMQTTGSRYVIFGREPRPSSLLSILRR